LRHTLAGDGEVEPNQEQVLQIALEICKEGVLSLFVQNLPSLGWEVSYIHKLNVITFFDCVISLFLCSVISLIGSMLQARKDLVHCWCILLRQKVDEGYCCVQYIENHFDLLDFLVVW
jgi:calcium binding protein 39